MMYSNTLVACIKVNNKILREDKENVYLPFGAEYCILIKNLNTVRALVSISIDDTNATDGTQLVVNPNSEVELKRFIKNGNLNSGNAFKFIERTAGIEQHRGIKITDGLIRVEFQFEKPHNGIKQIEHHYHYFDQPKYYTPPHRYYDLLGQPVASNGNSISGSTVDNAGQSFVGSAAYTSSSATNSADVSTASGIPPNGLLRSITRSVAKSVNDVGITVPGSEVQQQFTVTSSFETETEKHVLILRLVGEVESKPVVQAVTVKVKPKCVTCGKVNKATNKFCSNCGTALTLL